MLLCLTCDHSDQLEIFFKETEADKISIYEKPFAAAVMNRLFSEFDAQFGEQQDDVLGDDVWREGVVDGKRIEVSVTYHSGFSIRALESAADGVILAIAGSLARSPIELS